MGLAYNCIIDREVYKCTLDLKNYLIEVSPENIVGFIGLGGLGRENPWRRTVNGLLTVAGLGKRRELNGKN